MVILGPTGRKMTVNKSILGPIGRKMTVNKSILGPIGRKMDLLTVIFRPVGPRMAIFRPDHGDSSAPRLFAKSTVLYKNVLY